MIVHTLWLLLYFAAIILPGHAFAALILGKDRPSYPEIVALVLALGSGVLALILFWASLLGLRPSRSILALVALFFGAIVFWQRRTLHSSSGETGTIRSFGERMLEIAAGSIIIACVALVSFHALGFPVYALDSFAIWAFKAKVLLGDALLSRPPYFWDTALSYSHLDYPLLVPFLMAGAYGAMGAIDEQPGKIIFPLLYVALGFQIFAALRWKLSRAVALPLTALLMSLPILLRVAGDGIADVVLILFFSGAVFYFLKWLEQRRRADLLFSILYSAFAAFTKNEGLVLVLLVSGVMLLFCLLERSKSMAAGAVCFVGGLFFLHAPWLWWSRSIPRTHENYGARLRLSVVIEHWDRFVPVLTEFSKRLWTGSTWGGIWLLLLLSAVLGWRNFRHRHVMACWLILAAQVAIYILIFIVTPWRVAELAASALDRVLMQTTPLVVLLIGFHGQWLMSDEMQ